MSYLRYLLATPYFWITAAGIFLGGSVSCITRRFDGLRSRLWTKFYLGVSAAIVCGLAAVFVPGPERIRDPHLLWVAGVSVGLFFLMFRFRRSVGLPMIFILCAAGILLRAALSLWTVDDARTDILQFRALTVSDNSLNLEILIPQNLPNSRTFIHIDSVVVRPRAEVLVFDRYYYLLGCRVAYRNLALGDYLIGGKSDRSVVSFPARFLRYVSGHLDFLPGVRQTQVVLPPHRPFPLQTVTVGLSADGVMYIDHSAKGSNL